MQPAHTAQTERLVLSGLPIVTCKRSLLPSAYSRVVHRTLPSGTAARCRLLWGYLLVFAGILVGLSQPNGLRAAEPVIQFNLLQLPSSRQAMRTLQRNVNFFWDKRPLRDGLQEISRLHGVSIWLDRRIDPTQPMTFSTGGGGNRDGTTLAEALRQVATIAQAEMGLIENVVYLGPVGEVPRLQRAAVQLHNAISESPTTRRANMRPLSWQELATPRDVLETIQKQWSIAVDGTLPHDLLHAGDLAQPSTLATQLTLIAGGFSKQVEQVRAGGFRTAPLGKQTAWRCTYSQQDLQLARLAALKKQFAGSGLKCRDAKCTAVGTTDFHLGLLTPSATKRRPGDTAQQRWGFTVSNASAENIVNSLAASIGFETKWDPSCQQQDKTQLVSFEVDNATLDELLEQFARAASLKVQRDGDTVTISPR